VNLLGLLSTWTPRIETTDIFYTGVSSELAGRLGVMVLGGGLGRGGTKVQKNERREDREASTRRGEGRDGAARWFWRTRWFLWAPTLGRVGPVLKELFLSAPTTWTRAISTRGFAWIIAWNVCTCVHPMCWSNQQRIFHGVTAK
jgi:hypothetical protein